MASRENDFSPTVAGKIAQAAHYFCCRCLRLTGYANDDGKARAMAEAAHQLPAGKKGPRSGEVNDAGGDFLKSEENGLWLCRNCHHYIDQNIAQFPVKVLSDMKSKHERRINRLVGVDFEIVMITLRGDSQSSALVRNLVVFLDDRRVLFEAMDNENAGFAFESAQLIRARIREAIDACVPGSKMRGLLEKLQNTTFKFLAALGPVDWRDVHVGNALWPKFEKAVEDYRAQTKYIIQLLGKSVGYQFVNF